MATESDAAHELLRDSEQRLTDFLAEFRAALDPVLRRHGVEMPAGEVLHHRFDHRDRATAVLHFYVQSVPRPKEVTP